MTYSVEALPINEEGKTIRSVLLAFPFFNRDLNNIVAAVLPISKAGWVIVVKGGLSKEAICKLEKAITLTS